jgi:hypothetical protein
VKIAIVNGRIAPVNVKVIPSRGGDVKVPGDWFSPGCSGARPDAAALPRSFRYGSKHMWPAGPRLQLTRRSHVPPHWEAHAVRPS